MDKTEKQEQKQLRASVRATGSDMVSTRSGIASIHATQAAIQTALAKITELLTPKKNLQSNHPPLQPNHLDANGETPQMNSASITSPSKHIKTTKENGTARAM